MGKGSRRRPEDSSAIARNWPFPPREIKLWCPQRDREVEDSDSAHPVTTSDAGTRKNESGEPWSHDAGTATPAGTRREPE